MRCLSSAKRIAATAAVCGCLCSDSLRSATDHLAAGRERFFNQEYALAADSFRTARAERRESPTAHVSLAKALLYQEFSRMGLVGTSAFRDDEQYNASTKPKPDASAGERILAALREGQSLCERLLETSPSDPNALHGLAQIHALHANYEFMLKKAYFRALASGRRARALSYRLGKLRPDFVDGLLVAGLDEYIVGSLPWALRALIALSGYRGSKKRGAQLIARVAMEGTENRNDARILLALLHRREGRPLEAAKLFLSLARDFPRAYTYRLEAASMHMAARNPREALAIFREVERKRATREDRYDSMPSRLAAALARRIERLQQDLAERQSLHSPPGAQRRPGTSQENSASRESFLAAAPESIASEAIAAASRQLPARPAMRTAAPAFMTTMSRAGPRRPASTDRMIDAFAPGSPPAIAVASAIGRPKSAGSSFPSRTAPSRTSAKRVGPVRVISSMPSEP